eukprot:m.365768 g.365768  ORF g.365768 m.365768 type:complete len:1948 (-) comp16656_c0_seq30:2209-8052(-)
MPPRQVGSSADLGMAGDVRQHLHGRYVGPLSRGPYESDLKYALRSLEHWVIIVTRLRANARDSSPSAGDSVDTAIASSSPMSRSIKSQRYHDPDGWMGGQSTRRESATLRTAPGGVVGACLPGSDVVPVHPSSLVRGGTGLGVLNRTRANPFTDRGLNSHKPQQSPKVTACMPFTSVYREAEQSGPIATINFDPDYIEGYQLRTKILRVAVVIYYCPQKKRLALAQHIEFSDRDTFTELIGHVNSHPIVKENKRLLTTIGESIKTNVTDDAPTIALNGKLKGKSDFISVQTDGSLLQKRTKTPPWRQCLRNEMSRLARKPEPGKATQVLTDQFYCDLFTNCRIAIKEETSESGNRHDRCRKEPVAFFPGQNPCAYDEEEGLLAEAKILLGTTHRDQASSQEFDEHTVEDMPSDDEFLINVYPERTSRREGGRHATTFNLEHNTVDDSIVSTGTQQSSPMAISDTGHSFSSSGRFDDSGIANSSCASGTSIAMHSHMPIHASSSSPMDLTDSSSPMDLTDSYYVFAQVGGQWIDAQEFMCWCHEMITRRLVAISAADFYGLTIHQGLPAMHRIDLDDMGNPLLDDIGGNLMDEPDEIAGPGHKVLFFPTCAQADVNPNITSKKGRSSLFKREKQRGPDDGSSAAAKATDAEEFVLSSNEILEDNVKSAPEDTREESDPIATVAGNESPRRKYSAVTSGVIFGLEDTSASSEDDTDVEQFDGASKPRIVGFSVPRPSAYYTGRSDEMATLIKTLEERGFVALVGGAGTGTTQLALQYAVAAAGGLPNEKIEVAPHPGGVYYVLAENENQLATELVTIANTFGHSDLDSSNLEAAVTAVIGALRQKTMRWLLVVDNCDEPDLLCELGRIIKILSKQRTFPEAGRIIVTSRCRKASVWSSAPTSAWARSESGDNSLSVIELGPLKPVDAYRQLIRRFFHKRVSLYDWAEVEADFQGLDDVDKEALPVLIEQLKRHPLAIQQCGAYVNHYKTSFSEYLKLFKDKQLPKAEGIASELIPAHRAWELNVDQLSHTCKPMLRLLCILSLFESDYIPVGLFNDVVKQTKAGNEADVYAMLVQQTALLRLGGYDNPNVVSMLRVFRTFLHQTRFVTFDTSRRTSTPTPELLDAAVKALWAYADRTCGEPTKPDVDAAYNGGCRAAWNHRSSKKTTAGFQLLPHITSVLAYVRVAKVVPSMTAHKSADLATLAAGLLMQKSNYKESQFYALWSLELRRREGIDEAGPGAIVASLLAVSWAFFAQGRFDKALHSCREILEVKRCNKADPRIANATAHLIMARSLTNLGFFSRALGEFRLSLTLRQDLVGQTDHIDIAAAHRGMGWIYLVQGDHSTALECLHTALGMQLRLQDVDSDYIDESEVAATLVAKGWVHCYMKDFRQAEAAHLESLRRLQTTYRNNLDHVEVATALQGLGNVLCYRGKCTEALTQHTKALKMRRRLFGPKADHPDILASIHAMGWVYLRMGEFDQALRLFNQVLAMARRLYPNANHPYTAKAWHAVGYAQLRLAQLDKSMKSLKTAYEMKKAIGKEIGVDDHPELAATMHPIACIYLRTNQYPEALSWHKRTLVMRQKIFGEVHEDVAVSLHAVGIVHGAMGDVKEELKYLTSSLQMKKDFHGDEMDPAEVAEAHLELARTWMKLKSPEAYANAIEHYDESHKAQRLRTDEGLSPAIAVLLHEKANVHLLLGEFDFASRLYTACLKRLEGLEANAANPNLCAGYAFQRAITHHQAALASLHRADPSAALQMFRKGLTAIQKVRTTNVFVTPLQDAREPQKEVSIEIVEGQTHLSITRVTNVADQICIETDGLFVELARNNPEHWQFNPLVSPPTTQIREVTSTSEAQCFEGIQAVDGCTIMSRQSSPTVSANGDSDADSDSEGESTNGMNAPLRLSQDQLRRNCFASQFGCADWSSKQQRQSRPERPSPYPNVPHRRNRHNSNL